MIRELIKRLFTPPPPPVSEQEVEEMRARTETTLAEARNRDAEVEAVAARLAYQRSQNHFGPLVWAAMRGDNHV